MTMVAAQILPPSKGPLPRHWIVAAILVLLAHAGLFYWMIQESFFAAVPGAPPAAILIDLAPMPEEPPIAPPPEVAPEVIEPEPDPVEAVVVPEPPPSPARKPDAVLIPRPKPKPKKVAKPQPKRSESPARAASAATSAPTRGVSATSGAANASWHARVAAHLQRYKPHGAQEKGSCTVAFTVDRAGHVLGARLSSSSGSAVLDRLAVAAIQGASPVPAPPSDVAGSRFPFNVPVRFR
jgi:protein TonB